MLQRNVNVTLKRCFSVVISIRRYFDPAGIFWQVFFSAVIFVCMYFVWQLFFWQLFFSAGIFFAELLFLQVFFRRYFFAGILEAEIFFRQGFGLSVLFGFNHLTKEDVLIHLLWTYIFFRVIYALALHLEGLAPKKLIIW